MWYIFLLKFELAKSKFYLLSETQVSSSSLAYFETYLDMKHIFYHNSRNSSSKKVLHN